MSVLLLTLGLLAAQEAAEPSPSGTVVLEEMQTPVSEVAMQFLEILPATLDGWEPEGRELSLAQQSFAMVGREDLVARYVPGTYALTPCPVIEGDALEAAIAAAREAQIVIVNEAHNQPLHRHFIAQLAEALGGEFDVFAAETFNYLRLMEPRQAGALGYYEREPIFHRQVEAIEAAGYQLAAYEIRASQRDPDTETPAERIAVREEAQADNLIAEVLAENPDVRILVHVGYAHLLEAPQRMSQDGPPLEWFALRLKQKTGIDPLTITQTHCGLPGPEGEPVLDAEGEGEARAAASPSAERLAGQPALADPSGVLPEGAVDMAVAYAPLQFEDGRPAWRREIGDVATAVPGALAPVDTAVIFEARAPTETLDDMPVERLLLYPADAHPLLLPRGDWVITAWTAEGAYGEAVRVRVP
jgi:hypothetical protein